MGAGDAACACRAADDPWPCSHSRLLQVVPAEEECSLCLCAAPDVLFHPCGHRCCCVVCAKQLACASQGAWLCPVCRVEVAATFLALQLRG